MRSYFSTLAIGALIFSTSTQAQAGLVNCRVSYIKSDASGAVVREQARLITLVVSDPTENPKILTGLRVETIEEFAVTWFAVSSWDPTRPSRMMLSIRPTNAPYITSASFDKGPAQLDMILGDAYIDVSCSFR